MMATGLDASTKMGAYISLGCITPRQIHADLEAAERRRAGEGADANAGGGEPHAEVALLIEGASCLKLHLQIRSVLVLPVPLRYRREGWSSAQMGMHAFGFQTSVIVLKIEWQDFVCVEEWRAGWGGQRCVVWPVVFHVIPFE